MLDSGLVRQHDERWWAVLAAAGAGERREGECRVTVLARTDAALAEVLVGTRDAWRGPEGKAVLAGVLDCHSVPGRLTATDLAARIEAGGGKTTLTTAGEKDISLRSEERRVGQECVSKWSSRWAPYH